MLQLAARIGVADRTPTPILQFLAGDFAAPIAQLWPQPHAAFLTAPAARRHLVCLALALGRRADARLLDQRLKSAVARIVDDAPPGLASVLGRMGERAWSSEAYRALLETLRDARSAKLLWHSVDVTEAQVLSLFRLPEALRRAGVGRLPLQPNAASVVVEAFEALTAGERREDGQALAARWARADGVNALLAKVREDLVPEFPPHPFAGTERLRPLATRAAVLDAAQRYRNCLADQMVRAAVGTSCFMEWRGPPTVVMELCRDPVFGWRLDEARMVDNVAVPEAVAAEIVAEVRSLGVHVGRSFWVLHWALHRAINPAQPFSAVEDDINSIFGR